MRTAALLLALALIAMLSLAGAAEQAELAEAREAEACAVRLLQTKSRTGVPSRGHSVDSTVTPALHGTRMPDVGKAVEMLNATYERAEGFVHIANDTAGKVLDLLVFALEKVPLVVDATTVSVKAMRFVLGSHADDILAAVDHLNDTAVTTTLRLKELDKTAQKKVGSELDEFTSLKDRIAGLLQNVDNGLDAIEQRSQMPQHHTSGIRHWFESCWGWLKRVVGRGPGDPCEDSLGAIAAANRSLDKVTHVLEVLKATAVGELLLEPLDIVHDAMDHLQNSTESVLGDGSGPVAAGFTRGMRGALDSVREARRKGAEVAEAAETRIDSFLQLAKSQVQALGDFARSLNTNVQDACAD